MKSEHDLMRNVSKIVNLYWDRFPKYYSLECSTDEHTYRMNEIGNIVMDIFGFKKLKPWITNPNVAFLDKSCVRFLREYQNQLVKECRFSEERTRASYQVDEKIEEIHKKINNFISEEVK